MDNKNITIVLACVFVAGTCAGIVYLLSWGDVTRSELSMTAVITYLIAANSAKFN